MFHVIRFQTWWTHLSRDSRSASVLRVFIEISSRRLNFFSCVFTNLTNLNGPSLALQALTGLFVVEKYSVRVLPEGNATSLQQLQA